MFKYITVTGADDSVKPEQLIKIAEEFPLVEFGILLSRKQIGQRRFPSAAWLEELRHLPDSINLAGHVCGSWVREILCGKWPIDELTEIFGADFFQMFGRWQLNTHGELHKWDQSFLATLNQPRGVIFQFDNKNTGLILAAREVATNISALFDLSHGAGVLPSAWPVPVSGMFCGYAGGLSPENVAEQCPLILEAAAGAPTWIDAETHLRSKGDAVFDLEKVRAFLAAAMPFSN
jgi:hypothetical protein